MAQQTQPDHYREWLDSLDRVPYASQILRCGGCLNPHLVSVDVMQNAQWCQARDGVDWTCGDCATGTADGCHAALEMRDPSTLIGFAAVQLHAHQPCANDNWRLWADATTWARGVAYRGTARGELVPSISGGEIVEILEAE